MKQKKTLLVLLNFFPLIYLIFLFMLIWCLVGEQKNLSTILAATVAWIYLLPPLLVRLVFLFFGKPNHDTKAYSSAFFVWWFSLQAQVIYLRFPALEESLRLIPGLYSFWLRLWGAKIGKLIFWSAQVRVLDRPHIIIGDHVVVGFASTFSAHLMRSSVNNEMKFVLSPPIVGNYAILGGHGGMGPGAVLEEGETLIATTFLAPFQVQGKEARKGANPL